MNSHLKNVIRSCLSMTFLLSFCYITPAIGQVHDVITGQVAAKDALAVALPPSPESRDRDFFITLTGDLKRSSLFSLVSFDLESPVHPELAGSHLVPAGARYLVLFSIKGSEESLTVDGFLCSSSSGKPVFGRRYKVSPAELDICAHHLSDDLVEAVSGEKGFAAYRIAFTAEYKGHPSIYTVYPDGSRLKRLVSGPFLCLFPRFSPSRNWIVYTAYKRGFPEMFVLDVTSGRNMSIPPKAGLNSFGALSPDGTSVAATLSYSGNPEIYIMSLTGKIKKQITHNRGCDLSPCWSPDGSRLAYVSDISGAPHIYTVSVDRKEEPRRLTWSFNAGDYCVSPDWSADGKSIAFSARNEGNFDVFTVDPDSGDVRQIAKTLEDEESVSWASDSRHIVSSSTSGGKTSLVIFDTRIDGEQSSIELNDSVTKISNPTWSSVSH